VARPKHGHWVRSAQARLLSCTCWRGATLRLLSGLWKEHYRCCAQFMSARPGYSLGDSSSSRAKNLHTLRRARAQRALRRPRRASAAGWHPGAGLAGTSRPCSAAQARIRVCSCGAARRRTASGRGSPVAGQLRPPAQGGSVSVPWRPSRRPHCQASSSRPLGAGTNPVTHAQTLSALYGPAAPARDAPVLQVPRATHAPSAHRAARSREQVRGARAGARTVVQPLYEAASVVELARFHEPDRLCDHLQADRAQVLILAHGACARAHTGLARAPQPCNNAADTPAACISKHQPRSAPFACLATSYQPGMSTVCTRLGLQRARYKGPAGMPKALAKALTL